MSEVSPVKINGKDYSASPLEAAAEPAVADEPITAFYGILHCAVAALSALGGPVSTPLVAYSEALLTAAFRAVTSSVAEVFHTWK